MDSKFRSSFIPKSSSLASFEKEDDIGAGFKLFRAIAVLCLIASLVVTGGAVLYKMMLKSQIGNLKSQVSTALAAIDVKTINEIVAFDKRLNSVREIVSGHVAISKYFEMLEKETVSQVQFTDLKYAAPAGGDVQASMNGKAKSYAAIALQEDALLKNQNTISANFGAMKVDTKTGIVSFFFKGEFKDALVKFPAPAATPEADFSDLEELDLENI